MDKFLEMLTYARKKMYSFLTGNWPTIYKMLNGFLQGVGEFFKDILTSIFK